MANDIEREQVFGLTGGELADKPAIHELSRKPSFDPADVSDEWHHYVSIRWKIERS